MKVVWRAVTVGLTVILALAACSSPPPAPSGVPSEAPVPKPRPLRPEPPHPPHPPPAVSPTMPPESLTGLTRDEAGTLLGRPASETVRAMGRVWRYRRGDCALSLVFYPEVETAVERVLSFEFEGREDAGACLKRLRDGAGGRNGK